MDGLTPAVCDLLADGATLTAMLATYHGETAVFTTDSAPGDAAMPLIITAGQVVDGAYDIKTEQGRQVWRDVRCYAEAGGSAVLVEQIAERVRVLLRRQRLAVPGFRVVVAECSGSIVADEQQAYGRIVTVRMILMEG